MDSSLTKRVVDVSWLLSFIEVMAKTKYLLSTGIVTDSIEKYIVDLFRLNMQILPGEVPGSGVGFDFVLSGVKNDDLLSEIRSRMSGLADKIRAQVGRSGISVVVESVVAVNETTVQINIKVNEYTDSIRINGRNFLTVE